jgi:hypothetical protein
MNLRIIQEIDAQQVIQDLDSQDNFIDLFNCFKKLLPKYSIEKLFKSVVLELCIEGKLELLKQALSSKEMQSLDYINTLDLIVSEGFIKACSYNHLEVARFLVKQQTQLNEHQGLLYSKVLVDGGEVSIERDVINMALHIAYKNKHLEIINYLLYSEELPIHPNINRSYFSRLIYVFNEEDKEYAEIFINYCTNNDYNFDYLFTTVAYDKEEISPLIYYLFSEHHVYKNERIEHKIKSNPVTNDIFKQYQLSVLNSNLQQNLLSKDKNDKKSKL